MKLLFICSRNQWRSPTAEAIFRKSNAHEARSAGTSPNARIRVSQTMLDWADMVFVMEKRHKILLQERFHCAAPIQVLGIPDEYTYMDEELINMLRDALTPYLGASGW